MNVLKFEGDKYKVKKDILYDKLKSLKHNNILKNSILAGGAIRSLFGNEPVKDYDLFFRTKYIRSNIELKIRKTFNCGVAYSTKNASTYKLDNLEPIQVIKTNTGEPEFIISQFDFNVCSAAYDFYDDMWYFDENFFTDLANKEIKLKDTLQNIFPTAIRIIKYQKKGYSISTEEFEKLDLNYKIRIDSLHNWRKYTNSMYGNSFDVIFNDLKKENMEMITISNLINRINDKYKHLLTESKPIRSNLGFMDGYNLIEFTPITLMNVPTMTRFA